jgi:glucosamine--fructose-6-phosphate aminotransferase (isomerizing)
VREHALEIAKARDVLYLGRGLHYPIALEGALKLKEISYIHAEGYAAGELKHGPIALIDKNTPVVMTAPHDELFEKSLSNLQEVAARHGRVLLVSDRKGIEAAGKAPWASLEIPGVDPVIQPLVSIIPLQLLAYHVAVEKGTDVDQPRNLAKAVTVE